MTESRSTSGVNWRWLLIVLAVCALGLALVWLARAARTSGSGPAHPPARASSQRPPSRDAGPARVLQLHAPASARDASVAKAHRDGGGEPLVQLPPDVEGEAKRFLQETVVDCGTAGSAGSVTVRYIVVVEDGWAHAENPAVVSKSLDKQRVDCVMERLEAARWSAPKGVRLRGMQQRTFVVGVRPN